MRQLSYISWLLIVFSSYFLSCSPIPSYSTLWRVFEPAAMPESSNHQPSQLKHSLLLFPLVSLWSNFWHPLTAFGRGWHLQEAAAQGELCVLHCGLDVIKDLAVSLLKVSPASAWSNNLHNGSMFSVLIYNETEITCLSHTSLWWFHGLQSTVIMSILLSRACRAALGTIPSTSGLSQFHCNTDWFIGIRSL